MTTKKLKTKEPPSLEMIESLLDEVDEWYGRVHETRQRLSCLARGSKAYLERLPDLWTDLDVLKRKAEYAAEILDEFEESLTDE